MFEPSAKFEVKKNNDFSFVWQYKNDDSTPISLANTTVTAQVKDSKSSAPMPKATVM